MAKVDQFESLFRAAERTVFRYHPVDFSSVLVITDLDARAAKTFGDEVRRFVTVVSREERTVWRDVAGTDFRTAAELLDLVESEAPSLICTYRNLHSSAWRWPYSLGTHLDLLTQHTDVPVLVLPHPQARKAAAHAMKNTDRVMAITDRMDGDERLVRYGVHFTERGGTLWLVHVEDKTTFERYMAVIAKIPEIDTELARQTLGAQLLDDPRNYIAGCVEAIQAAGLSLTIESLVTFGHRLAAYQRLIKRHEIDLLVLNTKDEQQMAMQGVAYGLAVELRQIPLLML